MTGRRYTVQEKIKICETALAEEKKGVSLHKHVQTLEISDVSLYNWLKEYKAGMLFDVPEQLISDMSEELNETEKVDVMVFSGSTENNIMLTVDKPETNNVDEYNLEMDKRVFNELQWCFAMKGFKSI